MITVLGLWDPVWMDSERTERRLWRQTLSAYNVDRWAMVGIRGGPFTMPVQFETVAEMLHANPGPKTFLIPPGRVEGSISLADFEHDEDPIYVLANTPRSLAECVRSGDRVCSIVTPSPSDMFGHVALGIALHDREIKR